jgi:hypothetical protein
MMRDVSIGKTPRSAARTGNQATPDRALLRAAARTSETAERASELAESVKEKVVGSAESLAERGTAVIHGALHEREKQDSYLYGAAALALAAAVGIAVQRRMS